MIRALASSPANAEYLIYTFDHAEQGTARRAAANWHRYAALADEELARAQAQILNDTNKYRRVEVKKKYVDIRTGRAVDTTLCVYERGMNRRRANLIGFAMGACAIALLVVFYAAAF